MNYMRKILIMFTLVMIVVVIVGYTYFQTRLLIRGPLLHIQSPRSGTTYTDSRVILSGQAQNITQIEVNNRPIFVNEQGVFREQLLLPPGYSVVRVTGTDKFDRTVTQLLEVVLENAQTHRGTSMPHTTTSAAVSTVM